MKTSWRLPATIGLVALLLAGSAFVTCVPQSRDRYGRTVATCSTVASDIGAAMVRAGWAVAYRRYGHQYVADEEAARAERRGMWSGRFTEPEQWRRERR